MRGLVICWILIGGIGFFIFPWYVTGDGFFSIKWILEYSLEDYGSALPQVFINKKYWAIPINFSTFFTFNHNQIKSNKSPLLKDIFVLRFIWFLLFFPTRVLDWDKRMELWNIPINFWRCRKSIWNGFRCSINMLCIYILHYSWSFITWLVKWR